jgi:chromosome segregation ATPase
MIARSSEYEKIRSMTAVMSARNHSSSFAITSLTAAASEIESIPTHFSRMTVDIRQALAEVQNQATELHRIRNMSLHDLEKFRSKTMEAEQAQSQISDDIARAAAEISALTDEVGKLNSQIWIEKDNDGIFPRDLETLAAQRIQLQPKLDDVCRAIEAESLELFALKKLKKDAKRDEAAQKKRIDDLTAAFLSASSESERLKASILSFKNAHSEHQAKWQSTANDLRGREPTASEQ